MPLSAWVISLVVLGVVLEADLGRRKIGWWRVLRPLGVVLVIIPLYVTTVPTSGNNLALQALGVGVGVVLGMACHLFISVRFDPAKGKGGRPVSRTGVGYAGFWVIVMAARLVFIYGSFHWFSASLYRFLIAHQLSPNGLDDALIFMAITMALSRGALLAGRGLAVRQQRAGAQLEAA